MSKPVTIEAIVFCMAYDMPSFTYPPEAGAHLEGGTIDFEAEWGVKHGDRVRVTVEKLEGERG